MKEIFEEYYFTTVKEHEKLARQSYSCILRLCHPYPSNLASTTPNVTESKQEIKTIPLQKPIIFDEQKRETVSISDVNNEFSIGDPNRSLRKEECDFFRLGQLTGEPTEYSKWIVKLTLLHHQRKLISLASQRLLCYINHQLQS